MNAKDIFWLGYNDLGEKKVRTALTVIMVMIGVASIIALTSLTAGIGASIQTSLSALGPTSIIVSSVRSSGFTYYDTALISTFPNVSAVIPILQGSGTVVAGSENVSATIEGVSPENLGTLLGQNVSIYQGSMYPDTASPDALFSKSLAFPASSGGTQSIFTGTPVTLKLQGGRSSSSTLVSVSGIINVASSPLVPADLVVMSLPAAQLLLHTDSFNVMLVKAKNESSVTPLSNLISQVYGTNARILNVQQIAATASSIIGAITTLFAIVAGISLMVAAIGIMNVMLMAVMERTREIGIMKSVGFKSRDVLSIFIVQAMLIGLIGGITGILVGAGVSYALAGAASGSHAATASPSTAGSASFRGGGGFGGGAGAASGTSSSSLSFTPVITPAAIAEALFAAVAVSVIAGIYPAWRASRMQPIDALRSL